MRAKMKCISVTKTENGNSIKLQPVTIGSIENEEFFKWTPFGSCEIGTINDNFSERFVPGKEFYVDFSEV